MKTNKDYILRNIAGDYVLVPTGKAAQNFNGMLNMTETAAFIWKRIDTAGSLASIANAMMEEYEVDEKTAVTDVYGMVKAFLEHGLVDEIAEFQ